MTLHPIVQIKKLVILIHLILVFVILRTAHVFLHPMIHLKIDILNLIIDFYILRPEPIKRKPPMFTPNQIKTTIRPNTFTAQDAGIYLNAELDQFWNNTDSDTTLHLLG